MHLRTFEVARRGDPRQQGGAHARRDSGAHRQTQFPEAEMLQEVDAFTTELGCEVGIVERVADAHLRRVQGRRGGVKGRDGGLSAGGRSKPF